MKTCFAVACLLVLAGCDRSRFQNAMDPDGPAYHPHTITLSVHPAGSGTTTFSDSSVAAPSVMLQASAAPGWIFHHWSGQGTGSCTANPCEYLFPDTARATVRAVFIPAWTRSDSVVVEDFDAPQWNGNQLLNDFAYAAWGWLGERIPQSGFWAAWYGPSTGFSPDSATFASGADWRGTLVPGGGPDNTTSFHASWTVAGAGYAGFSTYFLDIPFPVDLSSAERIDFDAKGSGTVAVGFKTEAGYRLGSYEILDTVIALHAGWTHYSIPLSSFAFDPSRSPVLYAEGIPRSDLYRSVIGLNFQSVTRGKVDVSLDRIVLHGPVGSNLFQSMIARVAR